MNEMNKTTIHGKLQEAKRSRHETLSITHKNQKDHSLENTHPSLRHSLSSQSLSQNP